MIYTGNNWTHRNTYKTFKEKLRSHTRNTLHDSLQKTAILGTSHVIRNVLQFETGSLSGGVHRWFQRSTGEKRPVTDTMMIIIIIS
jgi:hypothetical protein